MNNKECVDILNNILNNIGVKGFRFDLYFNMFLLRIPINRDTKKLAKYDNGFGYWNSLDEMFMDTYSSEISFILECIENIRGDKSKEKDYTFDYIINDAGVDFLKCILDSGSLEEMKIKMQLMGYDV